MVIRIRFSLFALAALSLTLLLCGCRSTTPAPLSAHPASVRTLAVPVSQIDPKQAAIEHVHSLLLYQQSQTACQQHHFQQAVDLLERLAAASELNDLERAFCQEQRNLCLEDAGLPLPRQTAQPSSAPQATRPEAHLETASNTSGSADCGPRALLLVCQKLGVQADLETLRQKAGTTPTGTSFQGLSQAAQAVHLHADGVQLSREALAEAKMPALAWVNGSHFIAVLSLTGSGESGTAVIHDPNQPTDLTVSQEQLLRMSSGYLLLLHR